MVVKKDAENAVPAKPRARKAAIKAAAVDPAVQTVIDAANAVADDPNVQLAVAKVTPGISAKARGVLYTVGIVLGVVTAVATSIAAVLQGNASLLAGDVGAIALALTNILAKLNISKVATDLAKDATV